MALVPAGPGGLVRDTVTGRVFTPGGGMGVGWQNMPDAAVHTAPRPEAPKPDIPPPQSPPDVTAPGQPYAPKESQSPNDGRTPPDKPPPPRQERAEREGGYLWLRKWKLTVGPQGGDSAMDLSELAFEFHVQQQAASLTPWSAVITVYNAGDNILTGMQKELTHVVLEAGYRSEQYGIIFAGPIAYYKHGRLNATDTFVEMHAIQNEQAVNGGIINSWIPQGYTKLDVVKACIDVMQGVTMGQITDLGDEKSPRGRVLHGKAQDILRDVAHTADAEVFLDSNGRLHLLGKDEALEMQDDIVPILNSSTGLIDVPTLTLGAGVDARCLLNPNIKPGGQVKIAKKDITSFDASVAYGTMDPTQGFNMDMARQSLKDDGYYVVLNVEHSGQNRGNPWYSDIKTMPLDPSKVISGFRQV